MLTFHSVWLDAQMCESIWHLSFSVKLFLQFLYNNFNLFLAFATECKTMNSFKVTLTETATKKQHLAVALALGDCNLFQVNRSLACMVNKETKQNTDS